MAEKPKYIRKGDVLDTWRCLEESNPADVMEPLAYDHTGRTYGCDGIRIDGSPEFILASLSRLKDLLEMENGETRLEVAMAEVSELDFDDAGKRVNGDGTGKYACTIRARRRSDAKVEKAHRQEKTLTPAEALQRLINDGAGETPKRPRRADRKYARLGG